MLLGDLRRARGTSTFTGSFSPNFRDTLGPPIVLFIAKDALDSRLMYPEGTGPLKQRTSPIYLSSPLGRAVKSALR